MTADAARALPVLPVERCPGCRRAGSEPLRVGAHELRRCTTCRLVHAPEYADPDAVYVDGYLTDGTDFGPPNTLDPTFQRFLVHCGHRRMAVAEAALGQPAGRMLDVGCGTGDALVAAAARGWAAVGVEPVAESAAACAARGLDVRCALLQESGLPERSFDLVTAFHVVEHMADAVSFLELIARWARPGGLVMVEVPNFASVDRLRHRDRWIGLRPLEHIGHYEPATLASTMRRAGLEDVRTRSLGFLWEEAGIGTVLRDLGLGRYRRWMRPLVTPHERGGEVVLTPRPTLRRALGAIEAIYNRRQRGQVLVGTGRVP